MGKNKFFSKKRFFHMLTNRNEKSAYGSEIYLEKNSDMLSSAPLIFLTDLARISYHYGIRDKDDAVRLSGGKESDFWHMYYRHKGVLVFKSFEKYKCIIIDVKDTLLYSVLKKEQIYKLVQSENKMQGFFEQRKKYDCLNLSINEIYQKINRSLGTELTPEYELEIFKKSILKNTYVAQIVDMLAANHIKTIPVIRGCYDKEFYKKIFEDKKISFGDEIIVQNTYGSSYIKSLKTLINKTEKEYKISMADCLVYSSDYKGCVKPLRRANYNSSCYYPPKSFYKKYGLPDMTGIQGEIYKNMAAYELFGNKSMKSKEYSNAFAYFSPVITDTLEKVSKFGKNHMLVFVGNSENLIYTLYKKYYDKNNESIAIEWSHTAYEESDVSELKRYINACMDCSICELKNNMKDQKEIVLVDVTEQNSGGKSLFYMFRELYPDVNVKYYSWYKELIENIEKNVIDNDVEKIRDSINSVDRILQKDIPMLLKITDEKILYVYPDMSSLIEKEKLTGAVMRYIEKYLEVSTGVSEAERFSNRDMTEILKCGNAGLYALGRGGI